MDLIVNLFKLWSISYCIGQGQQQFCNFRWWWMIWLVTAHFDWNSLSTKPYWLIGYHRLKVLLMNLTHPSRTLIITPANFQIKRRNGQEFDERLSIFDLNMSTFDYHLSSLIYVPCFIDELSLIHSLIHLWWKASRTWTVAENIYHIFLSFWKYWSHIHYLYWWRGSFSIFLSHPNLQWSIRNYTKHWPISADASCGYRGISST